MGQVLSISRSVVQLKRSRFFLVDIHDEKLADVAQLLRGKVEVDYETQLVAISMLTESRYLLSPEEVEWLYAVPSYEWTNRPKLAAELGVDNEILDGFVEKGLLVSTADDETSRRLRQREEGFAEHQWHPYAAFYHLVTKHPAALERDAYTPLVDLESASKKSSENAERNFEACGPPPPPFHELPGPRETFALPRIEKDGAFYRTLLKRRTGRAFDRSQPLKAEDLATLLYYVGGCHGTYRMSEHVTLLKRTSPSGGSLHPVELYPLVLRVEGYAPGIYHYDSRDHKLVSVKKLELAEAEELAAGMGAAQSFVGESHLVLLLTARFPRNFWKYRKNVKTHAVVLFDAGHLCQTFQLICADLDLVSFFVGIDATLIDETLGIDGIEEGAVALVGCGIPPSFGPDHSLPFTPYTPGETEI